MKDILNDYRSSLIMEIQKIDPLEFQKAIHILLDAYREDKQIFIVGNGGSAGTANHFACDFGKNAIPWNQRRYRIHSLCDNIEVITALGNDIAFDQIFSFQLGNLMRSGDVLICISASGSSPNIVNACSYAKDHGGKIIVLSGFGGGKIAKYADSKLVTNIDTYERIEDLHLIILHMIVYWHKENANKRRYKI